MVDCHFHTRTDDSSTPGERAALASWLREECETLDVDGVCLIGRHLPFDEEEKRRIRSENLLSLFE